MLTPKRVCIVTVDDGKGHTIEYGYRNSIGPRIIFNVVRLPSGQQNGANTAQIRLYNISDSSFTFLSTCTKTAKTGKGPVNVSLVAGREEDYGSIFNGTLHSLARNKEGPDTITTLYCSTTAGNVMSKTVAKSYVSIPLNSFLNTMAKDFGITISHPDFGGVTIVNRTFFGKMEDVLTTLGIKYNFTFDILNATTIRVQKMDKKNKVVYEFNPSSGLLKPPIVTEKGVDIECLLRPSLNPGDVFILNARFANFNLGSMEWTDRATGDQVKTYIPQNFVQSGPDLRFVGTYQILQMTIDGDTHGNTWKDILESETVVVK